VVIAWCKFDHVCLNGQHSKKAGNLPVFLFAFHCTTLAAEIRSGFLQITNEQTKK